MQHNRLLSFMIEDHILRIIHFIFHFINPRHHFIVYALFKPPAIKLNLSTLSIDQNIFFGGGGRYEGLLCGYGNVNAAGMEIEDLLNCRFQKLIFYSSDPATFLHYYGNDITPDIFCVSSDINIYTQ